MEKAIHTINKPIKAKLTIPGSKSMTNRALLMAALSEGVCELSGILISDDTRVFFSALTQLGISIQPDEKSLTCIVGGDSGHFPKKEASIWCGEAGTAARFLLAACASSPGKYFFDAAERLQERPLANLIKVLGLQGAYFEPKTAEKLPFTVYGREGLRGGDVEIEGKQTGQFISALLMVAPFATSTMDIITTEIVSRPYVDMTCAMMADFGVVVHRIRENHFSIPVPQRYQARDYMIEPDLSTASYFFAAAAITGGEVTIQPIQRRTSKQGDIEFLTILEKMGCHVNETATGLTVKGPAELKGVSVNMRDYSDTFMTLAAIAPFAKTTTTITNIGHTRLQESDRIAAMREGLEKLKIKVEEGPDWLRIHPGVPQGAVIKSHNDHRIAMSFAITGLRTSGLSIKGAECVAKTCPQFFEMLENL